MNRLFIPIFLAGCVDGSATMTQPPPGISNPLTTAPYQQDTWVTDSSPAIDLVLVLDDDPGAPVDAIAQDLSCLMDVILGLDFHLGAISTDLSEQGKLRESGGIRWLDSAAPSAPV